MEVPLLPPWLEQLQQNDLLNLHGEVLYFKAANSFEVEFYAGSKDAPLQNVKLII